MHEIVILPEIGMSKNSVQAHQLHQKLTSVVPASWLHAQGQRGSIVAEEQKKKWGSTMYQKLYLQKAKQRRIPSNPQIVEGTKLGLYTPLSCTASKTQLYPNYVLHKTPKKKNQSQ